MSGFISNYISLKMYTSYATFLISILLSFDIKSVSLQYYSFNPNHKIGSDDFTEIERQSLGTFCSEHEQAQSTVFTLFFAAWQLF